MKDPQVVSYGLFTGNPDAVATPIAEKPTVAEIMAVAIVHTCLPKANPHGFVYAAREPDGSWRQLNEIECDYMELVLQSMAGMKERSGGACLTRFIQLAPDAEPLAVAV